MNKKKLFFVAAVFAIASAFATKSSQDCLDHWVYRGTGDPYTDQNELNWQNVDGFFYTCNMPPIDVCTWYYDPADTYWHPCDYGTYEQFLP
jgi:hypothetical protein